jgi:hypothetical protein
VRTWAIQRSNFVVAIVALLGFGAGVGPAAADDGAGDDHRCEMDSATSMPAMDGNEMGGEGHASTIPNGLAVSKDGYTLVLADGELPAGSESEVTFVINGPDGQPITDFDIVHEKLLHLLIVSRDLVGYAHLHPTLDDDGTWRVDVPPLAAGSYRAYADFAPTGASAMVLAADLAVPGEFDPAEIPAPSHSTSIDGYTVTFDGTLVVGTESEVTVTVEADGSPVADLEPYLGTLGHLVAVRAGDMAFLHVHPVEEADGIGGPDVRFAVVVPTPGTYRLFFDFSHGGAVHTASATFHVSTAVASDEAASTMTMCTGH